MIVSITNGTKRRNAPQNAGATEQIKCYILVCLADSVPSGFRKKEAVRCRGHSCEGTPGS
ncbi:MAG: hypothetical protein DWH91_06835 [Planctomycetota bacterium]|nr:MAG: hypothetical protein DWH91_06835 [Planctomycetota bacterium]